MARRRNATGLVIAALAAFVTAPGCTLKDQSEPTLLGPSELGLSLTTTADPDLLVRDGAARAVVTVWARDDAAQPKPNVDLRADILCLDLSDPAAPVRRQLDYGSLSTRTLKTGSDGKATTVYTAPPDDSALNAYCDNTKIWVLVTPFGPFGSNNNAANQVEREVEIRLTGTGIFVPPIDLKPAFTFSPAAPQEFQVVTFDGSTSTPAAQIAAYSWNFGDGSTGTGQIASHLYTSTDTWTVTLTITDVFGRAASTSKLLTTTQSPSPTASFEVSVPIGSFAAFFDASKSTAAGSLTIVSYNWVFGDGQVGTGKTTSHTYGAAGTYTVSLTVTDNAGQTHTAIGTVEVPGS